MSASFATCIRSLRALGISLAWNGWMLKNEYKQQLRCRCSFARRKSHRLLGWWNWKMPFWLAEICFLLASSHSSPFFFLNSFLASDICSNVSLNFNYISSFSLSLFLTWASVISFSVLVCKLFLLLLGQLLSFLILTLDVRCVAKLEWRVDDDSCDDCWYESYNRASKTVFAIFAIALESFCAPFELTKA